MLRKVIEFEDFDGEKVTEVFYFNISRAEVAELELAKEGGWSQWLTKIGESNDASAVLQEFKKIIEASIGRRSLDNRRFIKDQEAKDAFFQSNAYDALLWEMLTDPQASVNFVKGVLPQELVEASEKGEELLPQNRAERRAFKAVEDEPVKPQDTTPAWIKEDRDPTQEELSAMTKDQLTEAFRQKNRRDREK
jgi:hypothetical protein